MPHDGNTFAHIIGAVAFYFGTGTVGVGDFANDFQFARIVVELGLYIGETVDTRDDLSSVFSETVQDTTQRFFTNFVCLCCDFDSTFGGGERFVSGEECETFGLFTQ